MTTGGGLLSIFSRLYLLRAADNFASLAVPSVVYPRCRRRCCPSQPQRGLPTADWRRLRIVDNSGRETVSERCVGFTVSRFDYVEVETIIKTIPQQQRQKYEEARQSVLAQKEAKGETYRQLLNTFRHKMMVCSRARQYPENRTQINIQFMQIDKTVFVGLPFEVLAEIGLKMKQRFPNSVLVSCCGGY